MPYFKHFVTQKKLYFCVAMKSKLNNIVTKFDNDSSKFCSDKPKLNTEELLVIEPFAKKKDKIFESYFSSKENINKPNSLFKAAIKK